MNVKYPLASAASLIADAGRAAMLAQLLDGRSLPAGELARAANISAPSASMHLAKLVDGGFLTVRQEGRHRYYSLATPEIANALEALGAISVLHTQTWHRIEADLCFARSCYDHLAGKLAVDLTSAFERREFLVALSESEYGVTAAGSSRLAALHIDVDALRKGRRIFARRCLDWTERRYHIAGALGAALFAKKCSISAGFHVIRRAESFASRLVVSKRSHV